MNVSHHDLCTPGEEYFTFVLKVLKAHNDYRQVLQFYPSIQCGQVPARRAALEAERRAVQTSIYVGVFRVESAAGSAERATRWHTSLVDPDPI